MTRLRSPRGTTLVEVLVTVGLLAVLLGVTYGSLIAQMRAHATQIVVGQSMFAARTALSVLADQVAMAGLGVPRANNPNPAPSLVTAERSKLSFWTDVPTTHTYLTGAASEKSRSVNVVSTEGFHAGDSIYVDGGNIWYAGSVRSVSATRLRVQPRLTASFPAGSLVIPIQQVTFEYVEGELRRNGRVFIPNVAELEFTYDAKTTNAIRVIGIRLLVETREADPARGEPVLVELRTQVAPSNLAL